MTTNASSSGSASPPSVAIVSPTRNEAANVDEFVKRVTAALGPCPLRWEIVFADDSDDNTPEVVAALARTGAPVRCVHRGPAERRDSISGAVRAALATVDADVAVVIDGDLQHPPEILPVLVGPIASGAADFVIGTRYGSSGSAEGLRSPWRKVASRASSSVTRMLYPQYRHCTDLASGLFAFRPDAFARGSGHSTGFKVMLEALVRCDPERVAEIPYVFEERVDGLSKARIRDGFTLMRALLRLRLDTRRFRAVPMVADPHQYALGETAIG